MLKRIKINLKPKPHLVKYLKNILRKKSINVQKKRINLKKKCINLKKKRINLKKKRINLKKKRLNEVSYNNNETGIHSECGKIHETAESWIKSFGNNNNPGLKAEIDTGLNILIVGGLTTIEKVRQIPSHTNFKYNSDIRCPNLKGIINLTQSDNISGTADIKLMFEDGTSKAYSVTQYKGGNIKCIRNPSPNKNYGLCKHKEEIHKKNKEVFENAIKYRKTNFGEKPNKKWKKLPIEKKCPHTKEMCTLTANLGSQEWNKFDEETKKQYLKYFLDMKNKITNCDGIIYTEKNGRINRIYNWKLKIDISKYLLTTPIGIYIYHHSEIPSNVDKNDWIKNNYILKTQCKYNNSVIEGLDRKISEKNWKLKKGNPISSWNVNAKLDRIFDLEKITDLSL